MDYQQPYEIAPGVYWVGKYEPERTLQCNAYLLVSGDEAVLIDPGSIEAFPVVMRKVIDLVPPETIRAVVVAHQDPDVVGSLNVVEQVATHPDLTIVAHINTVRLLEHLGLRSQLRATDTLSAGLSFGADRVLRFLDTPFLHSPGAVATYDEATSSLFTGDLFGAVAAGWSLLATDDAVEAMRLWHETYMASNQALRYTLDRVRALGPERLLPQHGSVLEGPQVQQAIDFLYQLPCGLDLLTPGAK